MRVLVGFKEVGVIGLGLVELRDRIVRLGYYLVLNCKW